MPRIPIIPPRDVGAGGTGGGPNGPETLPPEQADALRALEARTARIDRELAVAQSWRAAVDRLAEAEDAEDGPPPGFTRRFLDDADKERAALLKTLPAGRQNDLEDDLLSLRSVLADRAAMAEASGLALRRRSGLFRALDEYRQGVKRDPSLYDEAVLRLDGLSGDLGLPEDRLTAMRHELRDALGNAAVDGLMANPERTVRVLSDGLFNDALSDASKARRLSEAQTAAAMNTLHSREQAVSGLATQARQGTAPDEAILAAERDGALGAAEAARLRDANAKAAERAAIRDARIQRVTTLTEPLDPSNPEDRAAASDYWDSVAEVYASDDAEDQRDKEFAFVERMGVLPDGLARKYQGALLSTEPTLVVAGATALADLQRINPTLVSGIRPDWMRKATAIAEFAVLDLPPERAIELAEEEFENLGGIPDAGPEIQVAAAEPTVMTDAQESGDPDEGSFDVAALNDHDGDPLDVEEQAADVAESLDALPEAIVAVLAEEGLEEGAEVTAALTQITEAVVATGLPLNDETAQLLARFSNGELAPGSSEPAAALVPILSRFGSSIAKILEKGGRLLGRLWQRLQPRRKDEDRLPTPDPLPLRPPLGLPDEGTGDEHGTGTSNSEDGDESLPMRVPFGEEQIPQIGDERIDAQLRGVHEAIVRGVDREKARPQHRVLEQQDAEIANEDSIDRMRRYGRLRPDQEGYPPYRSEVPAYIVEVDKENAQYIRVTSNPDSPEGGWLMSREDFDRLMLSPQWQDALMQLYAISKERIPTHYVEVTLPKGTQIRVGGTNSHDDWGVGGGTQIEILSPLRREWFSNPKRLQ